MPAVIVLVSAESCRHVKGENYLYPVAHFSSLKWRTHDSNLNKKEKLDDGWPESEKDVFQTALSIAVVKKELVN